MAERDPFRALADNAAEAIVTIDEGDRIVYANPAAARLFGYEPDELTRLRFAALAIPPAWTGPSLPGRQRTGSPTTAHRPASG